MAVLAASALAVATVAASVEAGWERQRMSLQDEDKGFLAISAVAPDFAIAAGVVKQGGQDGGAVFVTRDGQSWAAASPVTGGGPLDIHIYTSAWLADRSHGYVGGIGEVFVTDDGAQSWTRVGLGGLFGGKALRSISGLRPSGPAWAACSTGELLRTDDRGASWPAIASPLGDVELTRVVFVDEARGWVASGSIETDEETGEVTGYRDGGLALTTDGGESWEVVFSGEPRAVVSLRFLDASRGFMVTQSTAGSTVEVTADGGASWRELPAPTSSVAGAVGVLADVWFFDRCEGWLLGGAGGNDAGALFRTVDGGESWQEVEEREFLRLGQILGFPIEARLVGFEFVGREVGFASGTYETLFRYDADDGPPACEGGGPGDGGTDPDGDGGGRCECRAAGHRAGSAFPWVPAVVVVAGARLARRRWRS